MNSPASPPRTLLIAEIGENHAGLPELAHRMIEETARVGADIVKFQSYRGEDVDPADPEREWFSRVEVSDTLHRELKRRAEGLGLEFLSSPFTLERGRFLCEGLGLRSIKIASSEMLNFPLLDYVNRNAEKVYLSTGMATLEEVSQAVARLNRVEICVLHCVTQYPAEDSEANLRAILALRRAFPGLAVGYSDHTLGIDAPVAAVVLGAAVIEKHLTLDRTLPGTDHVLSATPEEFAEMARRIRRLELLLGQEAKGPVPREQGIREAVRGRWRKQEVTFSVPRKEAS